ncbi:olfactory receptor 151-like [Bombina bombina]|uniref:olfactory receptor 151-like n=1 Tax=Bombina bombina TaxID=8345 RepID=UPI00235A6A31|nr:olfactory receptor 151-like [Bombina bombina]
MDNQTTVKDFYIVAFSKNEGKESFIFLLFLLIYLIGVLANIATIGIIYTNYQLHTPMYFFLSNLSFIDICYITVTVPKLLNILLSGNNSISFNQCFTQMYFYNFMAISETILLSSMAYDRYVAICQPLHYHVFLNKKKCAMLLIVTWVSGCGDSLFLTMCTSKLSFCHSKIDQLFCDIKALAQISCANMGLYMIIFANFFVFGLCTFLYNVISYIKILISILRIPSTTGRKKAFSTCTSHFTVLILYYGTSMWMYMRPSSVNTEELDQLFSTVYIAVTPMLNPLIYSLRNKDVKKVLRVLVMGNKHGTSKQALSSNIPKRQR